MLNCYVDWGSIDSVIQTVNLLITDRHLWTPSHDFTLPAPPENTWSTSRKCWRKTGSDGSLRSRNRGWGCSAASSPRWGSAHSAWHSSVFHDADPTASCAVPTLVWCVRADGREESGWCAGGHQREPGRLQQRRKDAPHSVITDQESRSVHLGALMQTGFLSFRFLSTATHLCCVNALKYSNKLLITFNLSHSFRRILGSVLCFLFFLFFRNAIYAPQSFCFLPSTFLCFLLCLWTGYTVLE